VTSQFENHLRAILALPLGRRSRSAIRHGQSHRLHAARPGTARVSRPAPARLCKGAAPGPQDRSLQLVATPPAASAIDGHVACSPHWPQHPHPLRSPLGRPLRIFARSAGVPAWPLRPAENRKRHMYLDLFKLKELPFRLSPDPQFLYLSKQHARAKAYMESTIWFTDGFVVITGEVGSGKTTLIESFLREVEADIVARRSTRRRSRRSTFCRPCWCSSGSRLQDEEGGAHCDPEQFWWSNTPPAARCC